MEPKEVETLKILLEQSWLHIRHAENHRLWFTNMYFLVVAGVLSYLSTQQSALMTTIFPVLLFFLLLLAILGLIASFKADSVQKGYVSAIENIVGNLLNIGEEKSAPKYYQYLGYRLIEKRRWAAISFIYKFLYCTSIVMWIFLLGLYFGLQVNP